MTEGATTGICRWLNFTKSSVIPGSMSPKSRYVKSVFIIHVGGTRCVTSSTDNIMKIHVRITLTVECIRVFVYVYLMVEYNAESDQD